jgi:hypothetical protein
MQNSRIGNVEFLAEILSRRTGITMRRNYDDVIVPVVAFVVWAAAFSFVVVHLR